MVKKYRVRLVVDDVVEASSPRQAKEYLRDMLFDGYYGSRGFQLKNFMTVRRRKDLENAGGVPSE